MGQKKIKAIEQILVEQGVGKCEFAPLTHLMAKSFTHLQQNKFKKKKACHSSQQKFNLYTFEHERHLLFLRADLNPMPTEEIVQMFNELRSDLVLLYELKQAHSNCEYEQQMLRHRYEALLKAGGGGVCGTAGAALAAVAPGGELNSTAASTPGGDLQSWPCVDDIKVEAKEQIIDVVGAPLTPNSVSLNQIRAWSALQPSLKC